MMHLGGNEKKRRRNFSIRVLKELTHEDQSIDGEVDRLGNTKQSGTSATHTSMECRTHVRESRPNMDSLLNEDDRRMMLQVYRFIGNKRNGVENTGIRTWEGPHKCKGGITGQQGSGSGSDETTSSVLSRKVGGRRSNAPMDFVALLKEELSEV